MTKNLGYLIKKKKTTPVGFSIGLIEATISDTKSLSDCFFRRKSLPALYLRFAAQNHRVVASSANKPFKQPAIINKDSRGSDRVVQPMPL